MLILKRIVLKLLYFDKEEYKGGNVFYVESIFIFFKEK